MSKTGDLGIFADGLGVLVSMADCLARWIYDLGFFTTICKTGFDPKLSFVAFCRGQEVDWTCIDLGDPYFLYDWRAGEVMGLAEKRVRECK